MTNTACAECGDFILEADETEILSGKTIHKTCRPTDDEVKRRKALESEEDSQVT